MFGRSRDNQSPDSLPVYMDPIEFSQVLAIVEAIGATTVLEWGSGGSTRALLGECPFIERYVSVEHDAEWCSKVRSIVTDPRLELHHVAPDEGMGTDEPSREEHIAWAARAEREPSIMASYVGFPRSLNLRFDLVLVDGRARRLCLEEGFRLLRPGGVILLHDAQREDYHDALKSLGRVRFLEPWKSGQVAFVRRTGDLS